MKIYFFKKNKPKFIISYTKNKGIPSLFNNKNYEFYNSPFAINNYYMMVNNECATCKSMKNGMVEIYSYGGGLNDSFNISFQKIGLMDYKTILIPDI